ncbi:MAG: gluconate 2-dehydrogenase subunit 3 family protein [Bacteroidota bacterium]
MHDLVNPTIDRRTALRRLSGLLGGIATAPLVSSMLAGCTAPSGEEAARYTYVALDEGQQRTLAALVDQIIPATDTPGAAEAGVPQFVDKVLAEWFDADEKADFLAGLTEFEARATTQHGTAFADLDDAAQQAMVEALDAATYLPPGAAAEASAAPDSDATADTDPDGDTAENDVAEMGGGGGGDSNVQTPGTIQVNPDAPPFFRAMKELTVVGYYTSEIGATQELRWNPAPGLWLPNEPVTEDYRAWA